MALIPRQFEAGRKSNVEGTDTNLDGNTEKNNTGIVFLSWDKRQPCYIYCKSCEYFSYSE